MRRLEDQRRFDLLDIGIALEHLKNAKAAGFTHAKIHIARYAQEVPVRDGANDGAKMMEQAQSASERDAMQTRAETASVPKKVSGLDGQGWAAHIRAHPNCTLPPGAANLVVDFFDKWIGEIQSEQMPLL